MYKTPEHKNRVIVAGGGAAGCFAAITIKEHAPDAQVVLLERSGELLHKVSLSGGGRCNCTSEVFDRNTVTKVYPRGAGFLRSVFSRFDNLKTIEWFENRGVPLKIEMDGRVFPAADSSAAITGLLKKRIEELNIECRLNSGIVSVTGRDDHGELNITTSDGSELSCESLCIATGGTPDSDGIEIARNFGHTIQQQIPSLYSFKTDNPRLSGLSGISVKDVKISIPELRTAQQGDLLITHNGISGPVVIRLSSLSAPGIYEKKFDFTCRVNWCGDQNIEELYRVLDESRKKCASAQITAQPVIKIPTRLWKYLVIEAGVEEKQLWAHLSSRQREMIIQQLTRYSVHVCGRDHNKDEFVTCGGVRCSEIDSRTMESTLVPDIYFAGEIIDIDAMTGGYNLQAAWSTGWQAGISIADRLLSRKT